MFLVLLLFILLRVSCSAFVHPLPLFPTGPEHKRQSSTEYGGHVVGPDRLGNCNTQQGCCNGYSRLRNPRGYSAKAAISCPCKCLSLKNTSQKILLSKLISIQKLSGHRSNNVNFPVEFCKSVIAEHECGMMWTV